MSPTLAAAATASAAAAPAATPATTTATTATATPSCLLEAGGVVLLVEQMERGETDVGHLLVAKNEAVFGPVIVGLGDISGGQRRCGCAPSQRKPQSDGTQCRCGSGLGRAVLSPSLLYPCHGRFLRYVCRAQVDVAVPLQPTSAKRRRRFLSPRAFSPTPGGPLSAPRPTG